MKNFLKIAAMILMSMGLGSYLTYLTMHRQQVLVPAPIVAEAHSPEMMAAFFYAAKIYGKAGCGDMVLAEKTAQWAVKTGLPASMVAGQIATESTCNPLAVSNRGAVGLMQVVPKVWKTKYDFSKVNLFNPDDNMAVGCAIMADLVKRYGAKNALAHYYGTGNDGIGSSGEEYSKKVQLISRLE